MVVEIAEMLKYYYIFVKYFRYKCFTVKMNVVN